MTFTTLDPSNNSHMTLSGGNLVATSTATLGNVRAVDPQIPGSGKWYWEVTLTTSPGLAYCAVGLVNGAAVMSAQLNSGSINGFGAVVVGCNTGGGSITVGGSASGKTITVPTSGTVMCIGVDLTANLIWFRTGASGSWNATSGTANDPATGTGGVNIASIAPAYQQFYPVCGGINAGSTVWTANFGATSFSGTVPSGFTSGWTTGVSMVNNLLVTQAGAEAWVTGNPIVRVTQVGVERWVDATTLNPAITGVAATGGVGSLAPAFGGSLSLTGVAATGGVGSLAPAFGGSLSLTGQQASSAFGTLTVTYDGSLTLTGREVTSDFGSLSATFDFSLSLTGQEASSDFGTLSTETDETLTLTGLSATTGRGSLTTSAISSGGAGFFHGFP